MKRIIYFIIGFVVAVIIISFVNAKATADAEEKNEFYEPVKLRCTCYIDQGVTASGKMTRPNIMAGKTEWIGCVACVNAVAEDGSVGEFIGFYEILDTGYGIETGVGQSKIFKDRTLGTIETGETVDIWQKDMESARAWIDRYSDYVYIKIIDGKG